MFGLSVLYFFFFYKGYEISSISRRPLLYCAFFEIALPIYIICTHRIHDSQWSFTHWSLLALLHGQQVSPGKKNVNIICFGYFLHGFLLAVIHLAAIFASQRTPLSTLFCIHELTDTPQLDTGENERECHPFHTESTGTFSSITPGHEFATALLGFTLSQLYAFLFCPLEAFHWSWCL